MSRLSARIKRKPSPPMVVFGVVFALAALLLYAHSPWGVGVFHDSIFYLTSAENLVDGEGLSWFANGGALRPLTHFAPLYPLTLSLFLALGIETVHATRIIAALLYGANVALLGVIVHGLTRRVWLGAACAGLALISSVVLRVHVMAMSEPMFLLCVMACLAALAYHVTAPSRPAFTAAIALAALSYLTRYVGVVVLVTGALALLLRGPRKLRHRLREALLFGAAAFLPMALWMARNFARTGSLTNRTFRFHPPSVAKFKQLIATITGWVSPFRLTAPGTFLILLGFATLLGLYLFRMSKTEPASRDRRFYFSVVLVGFAVIYLASLIFSVTFFDASTPFDDRILSPLHVALLILLALAANQAFAEARVPALWRPLAVVLIGLMVWVQAPAAWEGMQGLRDEGIGYTGAAWRNSETVAWANSLPEGATIYTNEKSAINFLTRHRAYAIPEKTDPVKAEVRSYYEESMAAMRDRLKASDAYLILFHPDGLREGMPLKEEITFELLRNIVFDDAEVYVAPIHSD